MANQGVTRREGGGWEVELDVGARYLVRPPSAEQRCDVFAVDRYGTEGECLGCLLVTTAGPAQPRPLGGGFSQVSGPDVIVVSPHHQQHAICMEAIREALLGYLEQLR